jgi:uncharacterized protein
MLLTPQQVLLLPGWQDSGATHWQGRWLLEQPAGWRWERVEQSDWLWPRRGDWIARLDEELLRCEVPVLLAAHSLGCQLVAAWCAHSKQAARVRGALLVAPPDTERADMPPQLFSWRPIARMCLPFASFVVSSDDDPYCAPNRAAQMAAAWGARHVRLTGAGHINAESGLGDWPAGLELLSRLCEPADESPAPIPQMKA